MKRSASNFGVLTAILCLFLLCGCRTQFEKIRASGDPQKLYEKAFEYYEEGDYLKAQTLLELIISSYRGKKEAERIYFYYAYTHYHLGKYILASYYFENFSNTYSTSPLREEADFMAAFSNYKLSPSFRLDQSYSEKAIDGFQAFVNTFPNSSRVEKCNLLIDELRRKLERKAFAEGELYFNLRYYQSAIQSFENLLKDFPETQDAEKVRYLIVKSNYLLAANSILEKQATRFSNTIKSYQNFLKKYPESKYMKELNNIYETSTKKLNAL